jgi:hypothetical protein
MLAAINRSVRGLSAAEQIVSRPHVQAGEERGHDPERALAARSCEGLQGEA